MVLVAQTDGLGRYPASADPRPCRGRLLGFRCRIRALGGLRRFARFCLSQSGNFNAEAVFDALGELEDELSATPAAGTPENRTPLAVPQSVPAAPVDMLPDLAAMGSG